MNMKMYKSKDCAITILFVPKNIFDGVDLRKVSLHVQIIQDESRLAKRLCVSLVCFFFDIIVPIDLDFSYFSFNCFN